MSSNQVAGVDLSTIKKIIIKSGCLESLPCKHAFTLIGKDDSTIEKGPTGAIHELIQKAKQLGITIENKSHLDV